MCGCVCTLSTNTCANVYRKSARKSTAIRVLRTPTHTPHTHTHIYIILKICYTRFILYRIRGYRSWRLLLLFFLHATIRRCGGGEKVSSLLMPFLMLLLLSSSSSSGDIVSILHRSDGNRYYIFSFQPPTGQLTQWLISIYSFLIINKNNDNVKEQF